MLTGLVGNIQKFSLHDGPGIRSTVFLKGCPLACQWCHNPEDVGFEPQLRWQGEKCIACGTCVSACPEKALQLDVSGLSRDAGTCVLCGKCAEACPSLAMELLGTFMTVAEVLAQVKKDTPFYESSGGGVTLSGGEPLAQAEFAAALLQALKREGMHTALDTSGYAPWEQLEKCAEYTDLFLYDIKHLDPVQHERLTGTDNVLILENLRRLAKRIAETEVERAAGQVARRVPGRDKQHVVEYAAWWGTDIWLRIPLLPGLNDDAGHIAAVGDLARELGIREVCLLPYHHLAMGKYEKLGLTYEAPDLTEPTEQHMEELRQILVGKGLSAHIGG